VNLSSYCATVNLRDIKLNFRTSVVTSNKVMKIRTHSVFKRRKEARRT